MSHQQPTRSLDGFLFAVLFMEFTTFWITFFSPIRFWSLEDDSGFAHFWYGLWWLLTAYWLLSLVLAAQNRKGSHLYYGAGWVAYYLYSFLSRQDPVLMSSMASLMNQLNTFLGGVCLTLLVFRHHRIGHWRQYSIIAHFRESKRKQQTEDTLPTTSH